MSLQITDEELINELKKRFEGNVKYLKEQNELMNQLKLVNNKLLISEQLKSNFLSNIRNEINNPLASVLELSKNILNESADIQQVRRQAKFIYSEIFNLEFQLRNIFISAEIEAGEIGLSIVNVNINTLIESIVQSFKHQIDKKNITLFVANNTNSETKFHSDPEKLHLIISNLIANAIQFSQEGGQIKLEYSVNKGLLNLAVTDNGCGISEEDKAIIFDRFRQAEEGSTKNFGGHGLGLSITKALLEMINGTIELESKKNTGSTFTITVAEAESDLPFSDVLSNDGNDFLFIENEAINF